MRTFEKRCEITIAILLSVTSRKRSKILTSDSASIDAVGSSITRMSARRMNDREMLGPERLDSAQRRGLLVRSSNIRCACCAANELAPGDFK